MKLTKDELIAKVNETITDVDTATWLLEDIADSFISEDTSRIDELQTQLNAVSDELEAQKEKYKERFLSAEPNEPNEPDNPDEPERVDIEDIFTI